MGTYKLNYNSDKKTFEVLAEGMFDLTDAENYKAAFLKKVTEFDPTQSILEIDCQNQGITGGEVQEVLKECYQIYKNCNFEKVIFIVGSSTILKMQLNRIAKEIGLPNYEIIA
jgi:arginine/lysine/ornithine decarboxylase